MLLNCGVGEDSWESLGLQGDSSRPSWRKSVLNIHWKDWYWSWNSNILATWYEEPTHWKRPWCWERFQAGGEGNDRGWADWMASPTQWTGRHGVLQSMRSQRVPHDWEIEQQQQKISRVIWNINLSHKETLVSKELKKELIYTTKLYRHLGVQRVVWIAYVSYVFLLKSNIVKYVFFALHSFVFLYLFGKLHCNHLRTRNILGM